MAVVVIVIIGAFVIAGVVRGVKLGGEKSKGRDRCEFCRARMKKQDGKTAYASTCSKCGRTQSWAKA